ncbi:hypothetical protein RRG08_005270 [Elysia crispata]|uniref:Uncharacterized protein n=1 Tax=Elysia crispata TaxID=231223 RepID=A0AAE0YBY3_9GAST|nr:hypothetical protein RRG08_005270 [Elysia crispata]
MLSSKDAVKTQEATIVEKDKVYAMKASGIYQSAFVEALTAKTTAIFDIVLGIILITICVVLRIFVLSKSHSLEVESTSY